MINELLTSLGRMIPPLSYMIPLLIVMGTLERRSQYPARAIGSVVLFTIIFRGLLGLQPSPTAAWDSPASLFLLLLVYVLVLLLMAVVVLACCSVSFANAFFYAGAAYTVQNLSFVTRIIVNEALLSSMGPEITGGGLGGLLSWMSIALGAVLFYLLFIRRLGGEGIDAVSSKSAIIAISAALFFNIVFSAACNGLPRDGVAPGQATVFRATQVGLSVLILYMEYELLLNRRLQIEAATTEQLIRDRERQYETSRDTIDAINIKMHDIRHQIRHLEDGSAGTTVLDREVLREIASGVNVYDSVVKTGNDALNTILTEKSLLCESLGIEFTCSADGSRLSILSPAELYSLFGNMLDNAIEATRSLKNLEKKVITLGVRLNAGLITIHEENYFAGEVQFEEHVPQSTKNDPLNHGYGYRSMRMIVEGHGGVIDSKAEGDVFRLDIAIPVEEQ